MAMDLLGPRPGERVLDVGSGQGVLAPHVHRAGASYVGVDASARMVGLAARRHGPEGQFVVGDARTLDRNVGLARHQFDAAIFLLSIQDMDPLDRLLGATSRVLAPTARIVLVLTHPAFRVPRHSGWIFDSHRDLAARRVDAYLRPMAVPLSGGRGRGAAPSTTFHRPLSAYINVLATLGFAIDAMSEPPDELRTGPATNRDIPLFLGLRARR
jgi:ubiquinone/menaquinone biosynthesis C-methylase UbiE